MKHKNKIRDKKTPRIPNNQCTIIFAKQDHSVWFLHCAKVDKIAKLNEQIDESERSGDSLLLTFSMSLSVHKDYRDVIVHLARAYCRHALISCIGKRVEEDKQNNASSLTFLQFHTAFYHDSRLRKLTVQLPLSLPLLLVKLSSLVFLCILQIDRMLIERVYARKT